jgi:hypothetical protein
VRVLGGACERAGRFMDTLANRRLHQSGGDDVRRCKSCES